MNSSVYESFSFDKWYPLFDILSIEAIIIEVPNDVLNYFRHAELVIPVEAERKYNHGMDSEQHYTVDWDSVDDTPELKQPTFPQFSAKLKDAMNNLGGEVFVKMNWKSPKDAAWITSSKSLKCTNLEDIYLVLKGSEALSEDVNYEFETSPGDSSRNSTSHTVVLKRWVDMHPGSEFRCFVKNHVLVAISQRDFRAYYKHIDVNKYIIMEDICKFFRRNVRKKFPLPDYTFDIFRYEESIVIIDFNPFDEKKTKPLLFSWNEINNLASKVDRVEDTAATIDPEFRFLGEDPGMPAGLCKHSGVPFEVEDICCRQRDMSLIDYIIGESERQNTDEGTS